MGTGRQGFSKLGGMGSSGASRQRKARTTSEPRRAPGTPLAVAALATAAILVAPAAVSADTLTTVPNQTLDGYAKTQTATSAEGKWRQLEAGERIDPSREFYSVTIDLVLPTGPVAGNGPKHHGEADLRKPWASIFGLRNNVAWAPGLKIVQVCSNFTNPTSYGNEIGPDSRHIWVDIACADGRGYDFYRARWDWEVVRADPPPPCGILGPATCVPRTRSFNYLQKNFGWGRLSDYAVERSYAGGISGAAWIEPYDSRLWAVTMSICGHRGTRVDCFPSVYAGGREVILSPMETDARLRPPRTGGSLLPP